MRDPGTGTHKGFGFVQFDNFESADGAIEAMNGQYLMNKVITVCFAYKKVGYSILNWTCSLIAFIQDSKDRHGSQQERVIAAQNRAAKPNMPFAGMPNFPMPPASAMQNLPMAGFPMQMMPPPPSHFPVSLSSLL